MPTGTRGGYRDNSQTHSSDYMKEVSFTAMRQVGGREKLWQENSKDFALNMLHVRNF